MERPTDELLKEANASLVVNTEQLEAAKKQAAKHQDYIARAEFKRHQVRQAKAAGIKYFDEYVFLIDEKALFMYNIKVRQAQEEIYWLKKESGIC